MLKKDIAYENFNDEMVTETFYFHYSQAELVAMQFKHGGLKAYIEMIEAGQKGEEAVNFLRSLVLDAVGKKSEDGNRFIKNDALRVDFASSTPFSIMFLELCTDTDKQVEFINGVVPKDFREQMTKLSEAQSARATNVMPATHPSDTAAVPQRPLGEAQDNSTDRGVEPPATVIPRTLTRVEIVEMDPDELKSGLATGRYLIG